MGTTGNMVNMITHDEYGQICKAPNFAYLDGYNTLHVWHKPAQAMHCNRETDPVNIKVDIDCFQGYACFGNEYFPARISPDGTIAFDHRYPVLRDIIKQLAEAEGIPVK